MRKRAYKMECSTASVVIWQPDGHAVAATVQGNNRTANSPELLEALKDAVAIIEDGHVCIGPGDTYTRAWLRRTRTLIAKAEGNHGL